MTRGKNLRVLFLLFLLLLLLFWVLNFAFRYHSLDVLQDLIGFLAVFGVPLVLVAVGLFCKSKDRAQ
ncbi:MAG: hypothetical protein ACK5O7_01285 [Holosporales bacterium]